MFDDMFKHCSDFDRMSTIWGYDIAFDHYKEQTGKLMIATARNSGDTRLYARSIDLVEDKEKKEGWWNTFTITKTPCEKGTFIVEIKNVRPDKDGYPIFEVEVLSPISEDVTNSNLIALVFYCSHKFTERCNAGMLHNHNVVCAYNNIKTFTEKERYYSTKDVAADLVDLLIAGKIEYTDVEKWLTEPTEAEKRKQRFEVAMLNFFECINKKPIVEEPTFNDNTPTWFRDMATDAYNQRKANEKANPTSYVDTNKYPLLRAKCIALKEEHGGYYFPASAKVRFIDDLCTKHCMTIGDYADDESMFAYIEAALRFDADRKAKNKAKKTAAKKAKKAAAKKAAAEAKANNT